ncbi:MAG: ACT domain-containing protein, partial [Gammaproteobacteria bacterium]|nr:ACT domain-containing protein [Gammaproteobacteria bacterium]
VLEENGKPIKDKARADTILADLVKTFNGDDNPIPTTTRQARRQLKHFNIESTIKFKQDVNNHRTTLEIEAPDKPGLLSRIGKVFIKHDITVLHAKINTEGERARDIFSISDANHEPITNKDTLEAIKIDLVKTLKNT